MDNLVYKMSVKNAHYTFLKPKLTYSNCLFCPKIPKFTIEGSENQQIFIFEKLEPELFLTQLIDYEIDCHLIFCQLTNQLIN